MDLGHGHRRSVVILWVWTALLSAFVLYPTLTGRNPTYMPFGIVALAIVLYTVLHPSVRARRRGATPPVAPVDEAPVDEAPVDEAGADEETLAGELPPTGSVH